MKKYSFLYSLVFTLVFVSCSEDFEEINTNPNAPVDVETSFLLRQVIYDYGEQMSYEGFVSGGLLGQYLTAVDFNLFDRHSLSEPQFGGNPWPIIYKNLKDNEIILQKSLSNEVDQVYEGPARILKAYMSAALTDMFGNVPYSEALQGDAEILNPSYDLQEDIYLGDNGILDNLDQAIEAIDGYAGNIPLDGDIFYGGNLDLWRSLANSLKFKYLMRISNRVDVSSDLNQLFETGTFLESNDMNATFSFTDGAPNNFRMATARIGDFNIYILSETMEEILKGYNDPRIETFFRPTESDPTDYIGLRNGPNASETSISVSDFSLAGEIFRERTSALSANFLCSWELDFLFAEAAQKGYINADAQTLYEEGVQKAFDYWNTEMPANYLTEGTAAFGVNGQDPIEQIITQKWIANMINGFEGWIEYKRTGFPELKTVSASLNDDLIPVRMPYPMDEEALNKTNFDEAAALTSGNSINAPVWWDVD